MIKTLKVFEEFIILAIVTSILVIGALFTKIYVIPKQQELIEMITHLGSNSTNGQALVEIILNMMSGIFKIAKGMSTVILSLSVLLIMVCINAYKRGIKKNQWDQCK